MWWKRPMRIGYHYRIVPNNEKSLKVGCSVTSREARNSRDKSRWRLAETPDETRKAV